MYSINVNARCARMRARDVEVKLVKISKRMDYVLVKNSTEPRIHMYFSPSPVAATTMIAHKKKEMEEFGRVHLIPQSSFDVSDVKFAIAVRIRFDVPSTRLLHLQ